MKRSFDICFSLVGLIILMPLFFLICMAIYFSDKGPIIYTQKRVGLNGTIFNLFKFRSMCIDADKIGPLSTSKNDSRVTKVGKILRKTSMDELPQLINVLIGDMSIVGPRPNVASQIHDYELTSWVKRNSVRPGITGLAQAKMRSEATFVQRLDLDLQYIDKKNMCFDFFIILITIKQVICKGGE